MKERDANIELWRCFCMLAVVAQHVLYNNGIFGMDAFRWHIPGFLLISGYFGVRLKMGKIIRLLTIAYLCYWLTLPLRGEGYSLVSLLLPHGGWFLPFYSVLIVLSPVLNSALEGLHYRRGVGVSIALLIVIGWVPTFSDNPHLGMMRIPGMQGNGLLMMLALYIIGSMIRTMNVRALLGWRGWALLFIFGVMCCYVMGLICPSACHYASPLSILTAVCGFCFFMTLPKICGVPSRVINFVAPSMFSVYLIHECCIKKYQYLPAGSGALDALTRAALLFGCCICIDMIRRYIMYMGDRLLSCVAFPKH